MGQFTIFLTVVCGLLLTATICSACTEEELLVGVGYNLIYGNPDGSPQYAGRDPGLKRTRRILQLSDDEDNTESKSPPKQIKVIPLTSCSYKEIAKLFAGMESYKSKLSLSVDTSAGGNFGLASFSFSASQNYKEMKIAIKHTRQVYFDKEAFCHSSEVRYLTERIPYDDGFGVSENFYYAFKRLPETWNSKKYYQFLNEWGTHIVVKATMGGRFIKRFRSTLSDLYDFAERTDKTSVSVGGSYLGFSSSLNLNLQKLNSKVSSSSTFGSLYTEITVGSKVIKDKNGLWHIPSTDKNIPEPTNIKLYSISIVCNNIGYWKNVSYDLSNTQQIENFMQNRCQHLNNALRTYAKYLSLTITPDDLKIPLAWPDGTYGLPRAKSGCPKGEGFDFVTGHRKHDTEDSNPNNKWSNPLHLGGWFHKNNLRHEFCMKITSKANRSYRRKFWPKGHYCIYKKWSCPSGFSVGSIFWDDEDNRNANSHGGTVPDGQYDRNTRLYYCCRTDGSYNDPIALPTSRSFFLLRKGGHCQKVLGMNVRDEWVRWDDEDNRNIDSNSGMHPDDTFPNHLIHFCYYYK